MLLRWYEEDADVPYQRWCAAKRGLFERARACDEDVYQSPGALLPISARAHMRDADQGPKQVEGIQISAQIATLLSALDQGIDRALEPSCRAAFWQSG